MQQDLGKLRKRSRLPLRLVFEVENDPEGSWHLLYESDHVCLDLCLDLLVGGARQPEKVMLTGQLAHPFDPLKPFSGLQVLVTCGERVLARGASDRLGEFQLEYPSRESTALYVPVGDDQLIEVTM